MLLRPLALAAFAAWAALPLHGQSLPSAPETSVAPGAPAQIADSIAELGEILMIGPVLNVMREEGIDYGATLEAEMFPGAGGARWQAIVELIYDTATMRKRFDAALAVELGAGDPAGLAAMAGFFGDERGQRILTLELEARRALMDEAAEEAARLTAEDMRDEGDPRMAVLEDFARLNDLVESNVAGALNSNLAFYKGMAEGGAFGDAMTEEQILTDVWSQEADIRMETEAWLFPYLALAYGPLSDEDLAAYVAFSATAEGKRLNAAVFAAFDTVFSAISYDLGRAAARQMQGEDI